MLAALLVIAGQASWALHFDRASVLRYAERKHGKVGVARLEQWLTVLDRGTSIADPRAKLATINDFWNRHIQEGEDRDIWRQDDYWATPLETLVRGRGDCEDFVIGKYFSLVHLGVEPEKLRLIYVRAQVGGKNVAHMVLGYYEHPDSEPLILDNLRHVIRPASERRDLTPVFSFNAEGVYISGAQSTVDRISRWQGLLSRMRQEGFQP
ncbi:transglutaminase-like cysteine peptidase [Alcaligenaceae bacterium]|nr:transglutaminase-like cysteine peptidase [Alcaligenaceae bacterium]